MWYNISKEEVRYLKLKGESTTIAKEGLNTPSVNREIKDGIFKLLFEKPENAAELYYVLTGIECRPDEIQIITLTNTISGKLKNDLAFVVRGKAMVVGEHQSTHNKNMPARMLMYLGQLTEKWIKMNEEERFLYRSGLYKIPTPEFVVFYNGMEERPEKEILRLSDAFEHKQSKVLGYLELEVPVYNINKGMNTELFSKGEKLRHYSEFIAKIRELNELYDDFRKAVKEAVEYCIANGILADFLRETGGNIVSILATYDEEIAKKVYAREQVEDREMEFAKEMILEGEPIEKILRLTKLPLETVTEIQRQLQGNTGRKHKQ